jgi:hypothetical protein
MATTISPFPKFTDFVAEVKTRRLRTVRLLDEGLVEPKRVGHGAIVMQPMVRIAATAYDSGEDEILKWEEKGEAHRMVTIDAGTGRGRHSDSDVTTTRRNLHDILVMENLQVEPGEWTPESIASLRAVRRKIG